MKEQRMGSKVHDQKDLSARVPMFVTVCWEGCPSIDGGVGSVERDICAKVGL